MGYHDLDQPPDAEVAPGGAVDTLSRVLALAGDALALFVRVLGIGLLLFGLWVALEVVEEAWALYRQPDRIAPLAEAMERGTGIDATIGAAVRGDDPADATRAAPRLSYLLAWFFAPMLLFTAGYLAALAVRTGGYLALGRAGRRD